MFSILSSPNAGLLMSEHDGIELFLPELSEVFWSVVVVAILGFFFYKFVLPKADDIFEKREAEIDGKIKNASEIKAEAEKLYADYTAQIKDAKLESAQIKDKARTEAAHIISAAKVKATADAELIMNNGYRAVALETKRAENLLKKDAGALAMSITQKMLQKGVENTERQSRILDDALDNFERSLQPGKARTNAGKNAGNRSSRKPNYTRSANARPNDASGNSARRFSARPVVKGEAK
jgi:F-type H+-transporting ATPase subunit b